MTTAISVPFAAAVLLLAGTAAAQVSQADPQAIMRNLMDQGYADVKVIEDDGELAVSATRAGATRNFIYDRDSGQLVSSEDHEGHESGARDDDEGPAGGEEGRGSPEAGDDAEGDGGREGDQGDAGNDDGGNDGAEDGEDGGDEGAEG